MDIVVGLGPPGPAIGTNWLLEISPGNQPPENPDDTTRSRTRRWCADSCGNLIKVRKCRQKKKKKHPRQT